MDLAIDTRLVERAQSYLHPVDRSKLKHLLQCVSVKLLLTCVHRKGEKDSLSVMEVFICLPLLDEELTVALHPRVVLQTLDSFQGKGGIPTYDKVLYHAPFLHL